MNVSLPSIHPDDLCILDACAGFGMLGEAVLLGLEALGLQGRVVGHLERDAAAAAALVARMAHSPLDQAPVCDTLRSFDTRPWRGGVDILCAGLPCQPYSLAGKRAGNSDRRSWGRKKSHRHRPRGPVAEFLRIVRDLRPAMVLLENVPAWVVGGHFRSVGEELCRLGYTIEDPIFLAAGDVKAPHERERVFILAYLGDALRSALQRDTGNIPEAEAEIPRRGRIDRLVCHRSSGADTELAQRPGRRCRVGGESSGGNGFADGSEPKLAHVNGGRRRPQGDDESSGGTRGAFEVGQQLGNAERAESRPGICGEQSESSEHRRHRSSNRSDQLDNSAGARRDGARIGTGADGSGGQCLSGEGIADVGNAGESARRASESKSPGIERRGARHLQGCCELPLFPPGRGDIDNPHHPDWSAWAAVAEMEPANMPRVEPELSMVADGLAFARADLLRIGGNGVVTVAAAVAFAHLLVAALKRIGRAA